jgi:hypothetical protein
MFQILTPTIFISWNMDGTYRVRIKMNQTSVTPPGGSLLITLPTLTEDQTHVMRFIPPEDIGDL